MNDTRRKKMHNIDARQSQIGVIGDHAQIKESHFHDATPPPSPPFMVESLQDFVDRPDEFEHLIAHLLDENRETPVAITAALRGAGGYGKTMLARAICHDERIHRAFPDGILWVTLGQTPDVLGGLLKLYTALTGQRPAFVDVEAALARARRLRQAVLKQAFEGRLVEQNQDDEPASVLLERIGAEKARQEGKGKDSRRGGRKKKRPRQMELF